MNKPAGRIMRLTMLGLIAWLIPGGASALDHGLEQRLTSAFAAIEAAMPDSGAPGCVVAITDRSRLLKVMAWGYADAKIKQSMSTDSRFPLGSISKSFTAIALMQLADAGRFDAGQPIASYLPDFRLDSPFAPVTGRSLLSHTSGLPDYRADMASSPIVLDALHNFKPISAPLASWWYSDLGFQILGYALERIEDAPYRTIIQHRIFDPLGMTASAALIDDDQRSEVPLSYDPTPLGGFTESTWFEYAAADGSIIASAADLSAYARLWLNRGVGPFGRLLSPAAFTTLSTPVAGDYGYGVQVKRSGAESILYHLGSIMGFHNLLEAHMTSGFAVIVLTNGPVEPSFQQWAIDVVQAAYAGQPLPPRPALGPRPLRPLAAFEGRYQGGDGRVLVVSLKGQTLSIILDGRVMPLHRADDDTFRTPTDAPNAYPLVFDVSAKGRSESVAGVSHGADWYLRAPVRGPIPPAPDGARALVGHYVNRSPEGPIARVYVRGGELMIRLDGEVQAQGALEPLSDGQYRLKGDPGSPERVRFGPLINGQAAELDFSSVPLYRIDTQ